MTRLTANLSRGGRARRITGMESVQKRVQAKSAPLPAPTGGLDSVSPLSAMPPDRAIQLDNWFPRAAYVELRRGHSEHCDTGTGLPVESIMPYEALTSVDSRLFAASDGEIWDVTTATPSSEVSGLANTRFQHVQFATSGGNFLYCVNGADLPQYYDGTAWAEPTITGATASEFVNVAVFKNRLWFCSVESLDAHYLRVDSIQGAAFRFALGGVFQNGGVLTAIGTWSLDGGAGPDDNIAFISSEGEVAVYTGSDPTNAATFQLVGVYSMGAPIGRRCLTKMGGDLAIISIDGLLPLSKALVYDRAAVVNAAFSANIQPTFNADAQNFRDEFGWQVIGYPLGTWAMLNVPQIEGEAQLQYVMNTVTGAWCRFLGWNANAWGLYGQRLYFGGNDGRVMLADSGASDDGDDITADMRIAFNGLGAPDVIKQFVMARPFLTSDGEVTPAIAINVDYRTDAELAAVTSVIMSQAEWDIAEWDVAEWPLEERVIAEWNSIAAEIGNVASFRMEVSALGGGGGDITLRLNAVQILYIPTEGGYI